MCPNYHQTAIHTLGPIDYQWCNIKIVQTLLFFWESTRDSNIKAPHPRIFFFKLQFFYQCDKQTMICNACSRWMQHVRQKSGNPYLRHFTEMSQLVCPLIEKSAYILGAKHKHIRVPTSRWRRTPRKLWTLQHNVEFATICTIFVTILHIFSQLQIHTLHHQNFIKPSVSHTQTLGLARRLCTKLSLQKSRKFELI